MNKMVKKILFESIGVFSPFLVHEKYFKIKQKTFCETKLDYNSNTFGKNI